ncbi:hypothetical protein GS597_10050 [Synechococcales cyanobacterium C]|uniref:Uncharacterized protein n=1 Tax=Petrachloros mirabilis ULC683 TaxID=2781853 RepID=A0A8K2A7E6_9CYAN|nr:hypothetical protein [Petrachloros mirabilis]NCJ06844.1 hypothetical protein [Petrachloros mirabilis ULC683]
MGKQGWQPYRQTLRLVLGLGSALVLISTTAITLAVEQPLAPTLEPGTYLYGEAQEANQIGKGYIVFRHQGEQVIGAFYYPRSEFSCFVGDLQQKNLQVLALGMGHEEPTEVRIALNQLHAISEIGFEEHRSLAHCHQEVTAHQAQQVKKASKELPTF